MFSRARSLANFAGTAFREFENCRAEAGRLSSLRLFQSSQFGKEKKSIRVIKSKAHVLIFRFITDSFDADFPTTSQEPRTEK